MSTEPSSRPADAPAGSARPCVLFVNAGTFGTVSGATQDEGSELHIQWLRTAADVEVVPSTTEARRMLRTRRFNAVVFRTRGMQDAARAIRRGDPQQRVVMISALPPSDAAWDHDGLVWVNKAYIAGSAALVHAVLGVIDGVHPSP